MPRHFDNAQDNDDATNMPMFDGLGEDPLDLMIELEKNMGMSIVDALRLSRDGYQADAQLEYERSRKRHGRH